MISLYEGNGYTKYVLRSGLELTLHEDDFTDEEIAEMQQKELEKNLDKDLSIKLVELDVDVNLAYNKFFLEQVKKGIIKVEGLKL